MLKDAAEAIGTAISDANPQIAKIEGSAGDPYDDGITALGNANTALGRVNSATLLINSSVDSAITELAKVDVYLVTPGSGDRASKNALKRKFV